MEKNRAKAETRNPSLDYATPRPAMARNNGRWIRVFEVAFGIAAIAFLVAISLPSFQGAGDVPNIIACARNLTEFSQYLNLYSASYAGIYPDSLQTLILLSPEPIPSSLFVCAGSDAVAAPEISRLELINAITKDPEQSVSYVYAGAGLTRASSPDCVLVYEPLSNHNGDRINVLFLDARVEHWERARAEKLIAELQAGHNPPRAEMLK